MNSRRALLAAILPSRAAAFLLVASSSASKCSSATASRHHHPVSAALTLRPLSVGALAVGALSFSSLGRAVSSAAAAPVRGAVMVRACRLPRLSRLRTIDRAAAGLLTYTGDVSTD
jgi:hypothetical protein